METSGRPEGLPSAVVGRVWFFFRRQHRTMKHKHLVLNIVKHFLFREKSQGRAGNLTRELERRSHRAKRSEFSLWAT